MNTLRSFLLIVAALLTPCAIAADVDGDGIDNAEDNCLAIANPSQCDSDNDGLGNHCDADLDNNCLVNSFDLNFLRGVFGQSGVLAADFNCDNVVNSFDLTQMMAAFGDRPGPSALWNDCAVSCGSDLTVPMRWVAQPDTANVVPKSGQTTRACNPDGATMSVTTNGLAPGDPYALWLGWFENPHECLFPPPFATGIQCGYLDLFNRAADANFIHADSLVANGQDDLFQAFVVQGNDPKGTLQCDGFSCRNDWVAWATDDANPGVLINPEQAEYHAVIVNQGPTPGNEQLSGALPGFPEECGEDGACLSTLVGTEFVAGKGEGPPPEGAWMQIMLAGWRPDQTQGIGLCRISHYVDDPDRLTVVIEAQLNCVSVVDGQGIAYTTGIVTNVDKVDQKDEEDWDALIGKPIAVSITDNESSGDFMLVNFPENPNMAIVGGLPNLPGDRFTNDGCESGVGMVDFDEAKSEFWVRD